MVMVAQEVDLGLEFGEAEGDILPVGERPAEDGPLVDECPGPLQCVIALSHNGVCREHPLDDELFHLLLEPASDLADRIAHRDADLVEDEFGRVGAPVAELVEGAGDREAGGRGGDDDL
jgi:hypothetical protein